MKKPSQSGGQRLDQLLVEKGFFSSREKAQAAILAGEIWCDNRRYDKAGEKIKSDLVFEIKSTREKYVSRGGFKLEFALNNFSIDPKNKIAIDVGSSTGGFTDCLLQNGVQHVFSVDVGYGQLDHSLRTHANVSCVEKINARYLTLSDLEKINPIAKNIQILTMDVSFISVSKILPQLRNEFLTIEDWIILFKPQFEVGKHQIGKGGVVRSQDAVMESQQAFHSVLDSLGFKINGSPLLSPVEGKKSGNQEYLYHLTKQLDLD